VVAHRSALVYSLREEATVNLERIEQGMREVLSGIGEKHLNAEVLENTPRRIAAMYGEFFQHLDADPADALGKIYEETYNEMIVLRGMTFFSMCEHHFLPFVGTADVVYIPAHGRIIGASKFGRALDIAASRPQLQERLTQQLADAIVERLAPVGVLVRIEATHLCMTLRGVKKPGTTMVTSAIRGSFHTNQASREEALALIS